MLRILVVDDDRLVRRALVRGLCERARVSAAANPLSALILAVAEEPDVIVIDVCLGPWSGYDLLVPLRRLCPRAKLVMMSGVARSAEDVPRAFHQGAIDYFEKPFTASRILDVATYAASPVVDYRRPRATLDAIALAHTIDVVADCNYNYSAASRLLGMSRPGLRAKLKKHLGGMPTRENIERALRERSAPAT